MYKKQAAEVQEVPEAETQEAEPDRLSPTTSSRPAVQDISETFHKFLSAQDKTTTTAAQSADCWRKIVLVEVFVEACIS